MAKLSDEQFKLLEQNYLKDNQFKLLRLKEKILLLNPDIVIPFIPEYFHFVYYALLETNIPIITYHGGDPAECCYNDKYNDEFLKTIKINTVKSAIANTVLMDEFVDFFSDDIKQKTTVIPNPVYSIDENFYSQPEKEDGNKTIISIGRISEEKNHQLLILAFALIKDKYPDWQVKIFGGDYTESFQMTQKLETIIKELNLENQVFIFPATTQVYKELSNSQIFAFPSLFEGWGLALTEAMSSGLPCLVIDDSLACKKFVNESNCGLISKNNPEDYAKSLEILINNHGLRKTFGRNGQSYVKKFNPELVFDTWENLIRKVTKISNMSIKIILTCPSLYNLFGGIERIITYLANDLHNRGHEVSIVITQKNQTTEDILPYPLNSDIPVLNIYPVFTKQEYEIHLRDYKIKAFEDRIQLLTAKIIQNEKEINNLVEKAIIQDGVISIMKKSYSWKIGQLITWIPWKISLILRNYFKHKYIEK
jgi:glycosyltransferase involved in cell wall biosynthesis